VARPWFDFALLSPGQSRSPRGGSWRA